VNRRREKLLKWALTLKPGDIINDCTGFNVKIREIELDIRQHGRGWYLMNVDFQVTPYHGFCSLMHCGVEPEVPREKVESDWLSWAEKYLDSEQMHHWHGKNKKSFDEEFQKIRRRIDVLKNGGHITNERGMILKEFVDYPESFSEE